MNSTKSLSCYDICCGAGFFSYGFKRAGFNILGGIDSDKYAVETVKNNIPKANWEHMFIQQLASKTAINKSLPIFLADVIISGLPCQGFSAAGKCEPRDYRNKLYTYLIDIVRNVNPEYVIIENVSGILAKRNNTHFSRILNSFNSLGYKVDYRVYNAVNFKIAQNRKRIFIVASKKIPVKYIFESVKLSGYYNTVGKVLMGLPRKKQIPEINHTFMRHSKKVIKKIEGITQSNIISYRRLKNNLPAVTILSGHNALPLHPIEHRAISNREAARIQGIPDEYIFSGPRTEQTVQVANAVPLNMAIEISKAIIKAPKLKESNLGKLFKLLLTKAKKEDICYFRRMFIKYYNDNGRKYLWRKTQDPYKIMITEILLQRTKSDMVAKVWRKVMNSIKKNKNGFHITSKTLKKVLAKLGIFNRLDTIKNINKYINKITDKKIPINYDELINIPGIGIYIASAIRVFAFNIPDFPVDSNCYRFIRRFYGVKINNTKQEGRQIREFMNIVVSRKIPKKMVYGFLDFCASICIPKNPKCKICFLRNKCKYFN